MDPSGSRTESTSARRDALETCRRGGSSVRRRLQPQNPASRMVGQQIDEAVGPLPHVPDARAQLGQVALLADDPVARDSQPHETTGLQRARRTGRPASRECRRPCRRPRPTARSPGPSSRPAAPCPAARADADAGARVVDAVGDHRPAVVAPGLGLFSSSPPRAPCSTVQSWPLPSSAAAWTLRCP